MEVFVEAGIVLIAFILGYLFNWMTEGRKEKALLPPEVTPSQEMKQQSDAVNCLLNYSADIAYGGKGG